MFNKSKNRVRLFERPSYISKCVCVCNMKISDNMLCSINDKLEKILVKDIHFFTEHVSLYYITFSTVSLKKECLILCHVVGNNVAFVFYLT